VQALKEKPSQFTKEILSISTIVDVTGHIKDFIQACEVLVAGESSFGLFSECLFNRAVAQRRLSFSSFQEVLVELMKFQNQELIEENRSLLLAAPIADWTGQIQLW
jgi:hypothetical protein